MAAARRSAISGVPPATSAIASTTAPLRSDGNGWVSRIRAPAAPSRVGGLDASDVNELVEVGDEVIDEPLPAIGRARAQARNERVQRDRRDHQLSRRVAPDGGRGTAARSEHMFEFTFTKAGRRTERLDDPDDTAALGDVPHQLRGPCVQLSVRLLGQACSVLLRIGRQAAGSHASSSSRRCQSWSGSIGSMPEATGCAAAAASAAAASAAAREPSGQSLKRSVSHRPNRPGRARSGASATRASRAASVRAVSAPIASLVGRPEASIGTPTRTRSRPRKPSHDSPFSATGTMGTPARKAKYAAPAWSGRSARSPTWIRPSPALASTPPALNTACTRRVVSRRSVFAGLNGTGAPVQYMSWLRGPTRRSSSLGPNKYSRGRSGKSANRRNGSIQLRWLKQRRAGPAGG